MEGRKGEGGRWREGGTIEREGKEGRDERGQEGGEEGEVGESTTY